MHAMYVFTVNSTTMYSDNVTWLWWAPPVVQNSGQQVLDSQQTGCYEVHLNCMGTIKRLVAIELLELKVMEHLLTH